MRFLCLLLFLFSYVFVPVTNIVVQAHIDEHHDEVASHFHFDIEVDKTVHFHHDENHDEQSDHHHELYELKDIDQGTAHTVEVELVAPIFISFNRSLPLELVASKKQIPRTIINNYLPPPGQFRNLPLLN